MLELLRSCVDLYCSRYNVRQPEFSPLWEIPAGLERDEYYPFYDRTGCYAFYAQDGTLLYIGKASLGSNMGMRIGIGVTKSLLWDRGGRVLIPQPQAWNPLPHWVVSLAVENAWEAPSMEEYLIHKMKPKINVLGALLP